MKQTRPGRRPVQAGWTPARVRREGRPVVAAVGGRREVEDSRKEQPPDLAALDAPPSAALSMSRRSRQPQPPQRRSIELSRAPWSGSLRLAPVDPERWGTGYAAECGRD